VGFHDAGGVGRALVGRWDGLRWRFGPSPQIGINPNLRDVAALDPWDVWAIGNYGYLNALLIMRWNGSQWRIVPDGGFGGHAPNHLAVAGPDELWAVGTRDRRWTSTMRYGGPCGAPTPTPTPCALQFTDVPAGDPFYPFVRCLACRAVVSGYADGTFRPDNAVTRGQLAKIIANAAGFSGSIPSSRQTFADVPGSHSFWLWIERLAEQAVINGYQCGGPGEPCDPALRPYYRPAATATRGQICKIVANAGDSQEPIPPGLQTFADVAWSDPFWPWIERLAGRGIVSGYDCGGPGEPCNPFNAPYFRPGTATTRGQMAKVAANAFYPNCRTP
jgi:hypothetical protein